MNLKEKLGEIEKLAKQLSLHGDKALTKEQKAKETEIMDRMEFRLKQLLEECKIMEADIKIELMKELLKNVQ